MRFRDKTLDIDCTNAVDSSQMLVLSRPKMPVYFGLSVPKKNVFTVPYWQLVNHRYILRILLLPEFSKRPIFRSGGPGKILSEGIQDTRGKCLQNIIKKTW